MSKNLIHVDVFAIHTQIKIHLALDVACKMLDCISKNNAVPRSAYLG